jgi:hypothetical protein
MTSTGTTPRTHEYERGHSDWELERLRRQTELVDPSLASSMRRGNLRFLDVGCGARDTALLLAELVGDDGLVVGVDRARAAVALTDLPDEASERRPVASDGASGEDSAVAAAPNGLRLDSALALEIVPDGQRLELGDEAQPLRRV